MELEQLEGEIAGIGQRIAELRRAAEKKQPAASSAKESGNTGNSSKKSMKGRGSKKVSATSKRSSGSRGNATAAGSEGELDGDNSTAATATAAKGWTSMQNIAAQVTALATDFAALAVQHRAVALFAISAVGIYLAGDSASV